MRTPNIDSLARNGMRFDAALAGAPWCCPFRGSLLTGLYPHQNGVTITPSRLDPSIPTITTPLKEAGYHTAWIGKWHLDGSNSRTHYVPPQRRGGFDTWMGFENNNNQHECYVYGGESEEPRRLPGYETDSLTDIFVDHLQRHVTGTGGPEQYQPFFAALSVQPPHDPYVPPHGTSHHPQEIKLRPNVPESERVREKARMDLAGYYGMIENLDTNVGRVRQALKDMEVDRETYLVFFSDHGDMLGSHGQWAKSSPWEEAIRVPFIVSAVGGQVNMRQGRCDAVINHVDIAPTTLGLCGIERPPAMQGYDYSANCILPERPEYRGEPQSKGEPVSAYLQQVPRKMHPHSVNRAWRAVVTRDGWKYVCTPDNDWLLHDLNDDPYEQANLCYDVVFQSEKERCHTLLADWIERTGDNFSLPDITLPMPS